MVRGKSRSCTIGLQGRLPSPPTHTHTHTHGKSEGSTESRLRAAASVACRFVYCRGIRRLHYRSRSVHHIHTHQHWGEPQAHSALEAPSPRAEACPGSCAPALAADGPVRPVSGAPALTAHAPRLTRHSGKSGPAEARNYVHQGDVVPRLFGPRVPPPPPHPHTASSINLSCPPRPIIHRPTSHARASRRPTRTSPRRGQGGVLRVRGALERPAAYAKRSLFTDCGHRYDLLA